MVRGRAGAGLVLCLLAGCGGELKPVPHVDLTVVQNTPEVRFPETNLVKTQPVDRELMGKAFMPGGRLATYKKGAVEYRMFAARLGSPMDAAILLPDWRKALTGAKLVPSFGGYFGMDAGTPVFVFAKDRWIAGVAGLPLRQADAEARALAAQLR